MTPSKTNNTTAFLASHFKGASGCFNLCFKGSKGSKGLQTQSYSLEAYRVFEAAAVKAEAEAQRGADVYFEVCPQVSKPAKGSRGLAETASALLAVWVDIDVQGEAHKAQHLPATEEEALSLLRTFPFDPSCIVRTGGGLHSYWLLENPVLITTAEDRARARGLTDSLQAFFRRPEVNPEGWKVDSTSDLARLLRVPGTFNRKTSPAKPVEAVLFQPERRYRVEELQKHLLVEQSLPVTNQRPEGASRVQMWLDSIPGAPEGGRNAEANRVAFKLIDGWGTQVDGVDSYDLLQTWNDRCSPPLDAKELRTCYNSALKGVERKGGSSLACAVAEPLGRGRGFELVGDPGPDPWAELPPIYDLAEEEEPEDNEPDSIPWPSPLATEAFHGIVGEIANTIEPHTESDPAAILVQTLVMAGHLIGRGPYFPVERTKHGTNENAVMVGKSSKARKGTSWSNVREIGKAAMGIGPKGLQTINGLGSGEALVSAVQDRPEDEGATSGEVSDRKRLLIMEQEYAHVLKVGAREGSTLSPTLRAAWDGEPISNLTKGSRLTSTGHHLSFIGHITGKELRDTLPAVEAANGNANRNIFVAVAR